MSTFINLSNGKMEIHIGEPSDGVKGKFKPTSVRHIRRFFEKNKEYRHPVMFMSSCDFPEEEGFSEDFDVRSVITEVFNGFTGEQVELGSLTCGKFCPRCETKGTRSEKVEFSEDQAAFGYKCEDCGCQWVAVYEFRSIANPKECLTR